MDNKYLKLYTAINEKYLTFILTTFCRYNNPTLRKELTNYYGSHQKLSTKLYLESKKEYESISNLEIDNLDFHPKLNQFIKQFFLDKNSNPYKHQYYAWEHILNSENCVIATGTGSGKTESFLFPIYNYLINNSNNKIKAIIIYPLKALANDQYKRILKDITDLKVKYNINITCKRIDGDITDPLERENIYNNPPDILITNYSMLDRLLLDPNHKRIIDNFDLKFIVLDEIHSYRGAQGIDISYLIKRLQFNLLKRNIDYKKITYIGTSATLGSKEDLSGSVKFIQKVFNCKFEEKDIINDNLGQSDIFALDLSNFNNIDKNKEYKLHCMFSKPGYFNRCISCNKLYSLDETPHTCKCGSKLIFQINTCRNCGQEYYLYRANIFNNKSKIDNIYFKVQKYIEISYLDQNSKDILFFIDNNVDHKSNVLIDFFRLCKKCGSIHTTDICPKCDCVEYLDINICNKRKTEQGLEYIDYNNIQGNSKHCVFCKFTSKTLINAVGALSDENCSHIIFDELYCNLDGSKKILIFTDNVQKSSKFTREIDETHVKNIVRKFLLTKIKNQDISIDFVDVRDEIVKYFDKKGCTDYIKKIIRLELYNEIFSKKTKVGALTNRNWFDINSNILGSNIPISIYDNVFKYLINYNQINGYYELTKELGRSFINFKAKEEIVRYLSKKCKISIDETNNYINKLLSNGVITEDGDYYLITESYIQISKGKNIINESDNYYDNWNYDVPLIRTENDTAKTDKDDRAKIEKRFKDENNLILVATPTLELGIDIGDLNCVGQLNTPRSPANYTQRAGRAGRNKNSALVVTYLEDSALGGYYFYKPIELISGKITPPLFNIDLEYPLSKSLFSLFLQNLLTDNDFKILVTNWGVIFNWIKNIDKIKEYWIEYYNNYFKLDIKKYTENIYDISLINCNKLFDEWISKLDKCISICKENKIMDDSKQFTIDYFRMFGLLPDFAFGSSSSMVIVGYYNKLITGLAVRESCPPNTIDIDKVRYSCNKITPLNNKFEKNNTIYTGQYRECQNFNCGYIAINNLNINICPVCNKKLSDIQNKILFKPNVIFAKENKYGLKPKRVDWKVILIDVPTDFRQNDLFKCNVGLKFNGIRGNQIPYWICKKCGLIYSDKSPKTKDCKHDKIDGDILDKYNTIATYVDLQKFITIPVESNLIISKTMINTLLSAATIIIGCEDGEMSVNEVNNLQYIFYDTVEGGVGFIDVFNAKLKEIINKSIDLCTRCCTKGCIKCIGSYVRQGDLSYLDKQAILPILKNILTNLDRREII